MTPDLLLAQGDIGRIAIYAIVVAGIVAIALVIIRATGISVPSYVVSVLWILAAVVLGVLCIRFILGVM